MINGKYPALAAMAAGIMLPLLSPGPLAVEPTGAIAGIVLDLKKNPVKDARIILVELNRSIFVNDQGEFRFAHVPPGQYHLQALSRTVGTGVEEVTVAADEVDVEIVARIEAHQESVVVSANARGRGSGESYTPVHSLDAQELGERMAPTLGDTLAREPGVNATYYGPGASRPVIRGQTSTRTRILESGVDVGDASDISPDHAVATDPLVAEKVEVVRGAGTLLYGGDAVGGVVNILDQRVPTYVPKEKIGGVLRLGVGTVAGEKNAGLVMDGGSGQFAWHVDALKRDTGNYDIPGVAIEGDPDSPAGTLPNSALESEGATVGGSWVGENGYVGVSFRGFDTTYGIPAALEMADPNAPSTNEGVSIDLKQRRMDIRGDFNVSYGAFDGVRFVGGLTDYEHKELEGEAVGTRFKNRLNEVRAELPHSHGTWTDGVIGAQYTDRRLEAIGDEAFLPPADLERIALFGLQEFRSGPMNYELGLRLERVSTAVDDPNLPDRDFTPTSGSFGSLWEHESGWRLGGSLSYTERAPNAEELYSFGPHVATQSFEVGDPDLEKEEALGLDITVRKTKGRVTGSLSLFAIDFSGYIFDSPTGALMDGLPVFQYSQQDATFSGAELSLLVKLSRSQTHDFDIELMADTVDAELDSGESLPFIPPLRAGLTLHYRGSHWHTQIMGFWFDDQDEVPANLTPTEGYVLVSAVVGYRFNPVGGVVQDVMLRGTNLTDELVRNPVSRVKDLVPSPGRDVSVIYRLIF